MRRINKKGTSIQNWLVGLFLFVGLISVWGLAVVSLADSYDTTVDTAYYSNITGNLDDMYLQAQDIKNATQRSATGTQNAFTNFEGGLLSAVKLSFTSLDTTYNVVRETGTLFYIPPIITSIIIAIFAIAITFALITAFTRKGV